MSHKAAIDKEEKQRNELVDGILRHLSSSRSSLIQLLCKIDNEPHAVDWYESTI